MYNSSVDFVVKSILKSPLVNLDGLLYQKYDSFFGQEFLEKLDLDERNLKCESLQKHDIDTRINRKRVAYTERISKELNIFFQNKKIINALEEKFSEELSPEQADIWFDYPGYTLNPHLDDQRIKLSLQIYIDDSRQPGTALYDNYIEQKGKKLVNFDYKKNSGYALLNNSKSFHATEYAVREGVRKSIFMRYKQK
jgi:hypothetical protein